MPADPNQQLLEAKERLREKRRLEGLNIQAQQSLAAEKERLASLNDTLSKEESDVRKLEELSLTAMFHQFLGGKEERLNKERQEMLAARLKRDQCAHEVSALLGEISSLESRIRALGDPDADYESALIRKQSLIQKDDMDLARISESLGDMNSDVKELYEAIKAGNHVVAGLDSVIAHFKSAGNWGIADLVGGGLIVTAVKHSKIDRARSGIHDIQGRLGRFERELADLRMTPGAPLDVEISSFQKFADFLFDGLIFDWIVQSKIRKSLDAALDMKARVEAILQDLNRSLEAKQKTRDETERKKRDYVEKA